MARKGVGVSVADRTGWSSIRRPMNPLRRQPQEASMPRTPQPPSTDIESDADTDTEPPPAQHGLPSRKRMQDADRITSENEIDRQGGNEDAVLSRAMLAQIAQRMRIARAGGPAMPAATMAQDGENIVVMGPDGPVVVAADNCCVSLFLGIVEER